MGYDLQYRVYVPDAAESVESMPVLFITDGPAYIDQGRVPSMLDQLIGAEKIGPMIAVFVDSRNPDDLGINRRNHEFFCNADYLRFYSDELIPAIEKAYPVERDREARAILGLSFGGLNAACFGLHGYETFHGIGMHSPANHPVRELLPAYANGPKRPLRIFLSTGSPNDNTQANRRFRGVLKKRGYDMQYVETKEGHNWANWRPLIDDVLLYFYAEQPPGD